jgi:hypothetical protein
MQIILAILLIIIGVVLFLAKRSIGNEDLGRAANVGSIVATIAGIIILAFYTAALGSTKDPSTTGTLSNGEQIYVGQVIDSDSQKPIASAKITLYLGEVPRIEYTDSEGVYRFRIEIKSSISSQVRVEAQGYEVYTRTISLSPNQTNMEDIRLTPRFSKSPSTEEPAVSTPPSNPTSEAQDQIFMVDAQSALGSIADLDSTECLWTQVNGRGATLVLTLQGETTIHQLRIELFGNFVRKLKLTFSDGSQQTKDLKLTDDYKYQEVDLDPVKTSSITVEVLEVQDSFLSVFGICDIQVFGKKLPLVEIFPQIGAGQEYTFQDQLFNRQITGIAEDCTRSGSNGLQLNYTMQSPEDFGGWGVQWENTSAGHFDASGFTTFTFWVRGAKGGEALQVVFYDTQEEGQTVKVHELASITTQWTQINLPLTRFDRVNLSTIHHIDFSFFGRDGIGSLCIDDIGFES